MTANLEARDGGVEMILTNPSRSLWRTGQSGKIGGKLQLQTVQFSGIRSPLYTRANRQRFRHNPNCAADQPLSRISRAAMESITPSNVGGAPKIIPLIAP